MIHFKDDTYRCTSEIVLKLVSGKWKLAILYALSTRSMRFNEIQRLLPDATQRVLTLQLRDLEQDLLVVRKVYPVIPPKVEYSLSELGFEMVPLLNILCDFGTTYLSSTFHHDSYIRETNN
ncbi:winged helix-turn-helix transcriptional regulator [Paenibacillus sp. GCM10027628]|uniref:winged helix-turn-helix transcriptional regulator n=1 Tax=Paenibacillus sp. GCM10027628 TaxID=3273413 RepID=UPI00362792C3